MVALAEVQGAGSGNDDVCTRNGVRVQLHHRRSGVNCTQACQRCITPYNVVKHDDELLWRRVVGKETPEGRHQTKFGMRQ